MKSVRNIDAFKHEVEDEVFARPDPAAGPAV
jgi:hypothetical protein